MLTEPNRVAAFNVKKLKSTPLFGALDQMRHEHLITLQGGRGSGKSHSTIEHYLLDFVNESRCNYLFAIAFTSLVKSAFLPTIEAVISKYDLSGELRVLKSPLRVINSKGMEIVCTGFDKPEKAKTVSKIGRTFVDEVTLMDFSILKTVINTTREIEDWQVIVAFNPVSPDLPIKTHFIDDDMYAADMVLVQSTCEDNPFLPDSKKQAYRNLKGVEREVDYLGNFGTITTDRVFGDKLRKVYSIPDYAIMAAYGLDFSNGGADPHSLVELWVADAELFVRPVYEGNCELATYTDGEEGVLVDADPDNTDLLSILSYRCEHLGEENDAGLRVGCIADTANMANITTLQGFGLPVYPAVKGRVKDGIDKANLFKAINLVQVDGYDMESFNSQFYNYRYLNKGGAVQYGVIDKRSARHAIDAFRYALEQIN